MLSGFALDLAIGVFVLVLVSVAMQLGWSVWRGFELAHQARAAGLQPDPRTLMARIGTPGVLMQILMALVATASSALVLYLARRPADADARRASWQAIRRPATWGYVVAVAAAVVLLSNGVAWICQALGIHPVPSNEAMVEQAIGRWPWFLVLFAVVLAPCYEELMFRRVLFGRFLDAGRPWLGMVLSGLAFALMHEVPGLSGNGPAAIAQLWLIYGGMGAAFAWLYWRTGTLWACIAAHALNNAVALLALKFAGTAS
ncbi:CPBP family intramembrane glutamic endopeptidase [Xanthomonas massiliensis]|uniref:CPBP family intramembrane glutamic endopeptidase n=1 Tax=Xanthomonas massiliensis TaxID=1720302 RepID=UPI0009901FFD|nr:CPBP family intramembrane glutamic endopeptidase [Xanthomonas massiliensis]